MIPRGLRNNNPLNIRHNTDVFQGEITGNDESFKTFSTMPYGYRAAFVTLTTYLSRGWDPIEKIISHWAPPSETTRTEYRDNYLRDSIYFRFSILIKEKGDTLIMEKYSYLYRDKIIRDSIFKTDTIRVPYLVDVVKEVKAPLSGWQNFQVWCGRIAFVVELFTVYGYLGSAEKIQLYVIQKYLITFVYN